MLIRTLVWLSALAFLASWFLPALEGVPGWAAFRHALSPLMPFGQPANLGEHSVPAVLSALTNVMFVVLLGLWVSGQMFRPGMFVRLALACLLLDLYWLVQAMRDGDVASLRLGYYVWLAAFALLFAAAVLTAFEARRTSRTPTADMPS